MHLRSLINGQTHHMEHIVRSLNKAPELSDYVDDGFGDVDETGEEAKVGEEHVGRDILAAPEEHDRSFSRASTTDGIDAVKVHPDMEQSFFTSLVGDGSKRVNRLSIADAADRHLRDKTDAIADIIRNISEQCAAAVEGLQLAHDADEEGDLIDGYKREEKHLATPPEGIEHSRFDEGSDAGEGASEHESSFLHPSARNSSIPPTPDLVHNRSSTSMSNGSQSTGADRGSQQYSTHGDSRTKIMADDQDLEGASDAGQSESGAVPSKHAGTDALRPLTARVMPSGH